MNKEAFVYIWENITDNKYYIGYHKGNENDGYISSSHSKNFWADFENPEKEWKRYVIFYGTCNECLTFEQLILEDLDLHQPEFYNNAKGAKIIWTEELKAQRSESQKKWWAEVDEEFLLERNKKISLAQKGKKRSAKELAKFKEWCESIKGKTFIERFGEVKAKQIGQKIAKANTGQKRTPEFKEEQRQRALGNTYGTLQTEENREIKKERWLGENNPNFGKPLSEEVKKKISNSKKGKPSLFKGMPRPKITCPHCGKIGGAGLMHRWHFDRCKKLWQDETE